MMGDDIWARGHVLRRSNGLRQGSVGSTEVREERLGTTS